MKESTHVWRDRSAGINVIAWQAKEILAHRVRRWEVPPAFAEYFLSGQLEFIDGVLYTCWPKRIPVERDFWLMINPNKTIGTASDNWFRNHFVEWVIETPDLPEKSETKNSTVSKSVEKAIESYRYIKKNHAWFNVHGEEVTAWQVEDLLFFYDAKKRLPVGFVDASYPLEVDLTGKVVRQIHDGTFQVLNEYDWVVLHGNILHVIKNDVFKEHYSETPIPAEPVNKVTPDASRGVIEIGKLVDAWGLDFHLGNVVWNVARSKDHPATELDMLENARWSLERRIMKLKDQKNG